MSGQPLEHQTSESLPRKPLRVTREKKELGDFPMRFMFLFAKRFIAGESLAEALSVIRKIKDRGFRTTVDILGESVTHVDQAKVATEEYCELISRLSEKGLELNISLKPTMLGLDISKELCFENVRKILKRAKEVDAFVRIDMEGSNTTDDTLELVRRWHQEYPKMGTVIQTMLKRSSADVEALIKDGIPIRLCKGAYKEPEEIAFKDKKDVDRQYATLACELISSGIYHGIATHDEKLINEIKEYATCHDISKDAFEFQMLYGIRSGLQEDLLREGWRVRVYIPYGKHWFKYTIRRLRERKENIWFVAKNLFRR